MPTLSVIIPVYNTKKYLNQCFNSVINQSYKDLEVIIVDDGSTDGSREVCDKYRYVDKRVKVIHQENQGLISARKTGVINAKGEYIGFVDSDDWIAEDMYEELMYTAKREKCDVVSMGYTYVADTQIQEDDATFFGIFDSRNNLDILLSNMMYDIRSQRRGVHPSLCCKVIVRDLLQDSLMKVDNTISLGEDAAVFYPCCLSVNRIAILKEYKYFYRFHGDSMCHSFDINTFSKIDYLYRYLEKRFLQYGNKYNIQEQLKMYIGDFVQQTLKQVFDLNIYLQRPAIFPCNIVEEGSKVILYGAGKVGQSYYKQILENNYCNIIAWVDKKGDIKKNIIKPDRIKNLDYSKIIIAVYYKALAEEIKNELIEIGIKEEKILWAKPENLLCY